MELMFELIGILVVLILLIIFLLYKVLNNKLNIYNIKISKAKNKLKISLTEKFDLTLNMVEFLNKNITIDEDTLHEFLNTNTKKIEIDKLNEILIDADKNIEGFLSHNQKIINNKDFIELNDKLKKLNTAINATKKYYNSNIVEYNHLIKKFPASLIAKIKKLKEEEKLKENPHTKLKILNK